MLLLLQPIFNAQLQHVQLLLLLNARALLLVDGLTCLLLNVYVQLLVFRLLHGYGQLLDVLLLLQPIFMLLIPGAYVQPLLASEGFTRA